MNYYPFITSFFLEFLNKVNNEVKRFFTDFLLKKAMQNSSKKLKIVPKIDINQTINFSQLPTINFIFYFKYAQNIVDCSIKCLNKHLINILK